MSSQGHDNTSMDVTGPSSITFFAPDVVAHGFCPDPTAWTIDKARRPENRSQVVVEERQHREGVEQCYHRSREGLANGDQATVGSASSKVGGQGGHPPAPCGRRPSPSSRAGPELHHQEPPLLACSSAQQLPPTAIGRCGRRERSGWGPKKSYGPGQPHMT
jgi:hypothetical protein